MGIDWAGLFTWRHLFNLIDILIVWFLFYQLIKIIQNRRALNILYGVLVFLLVKIISTLFQLQTLDWIMNSIIQWAVLGVLVIFQPEIRHALEHIGQRLSRTPRYNTMERGQKNMEAIITACQYMSKRRIGALITIENEQSLDEIAKTGIPLEADISSQLLINIFIPNTPLHDGAVIIQNEQITSAASFLPLSENPDIPKELGTRHRAAVGVSEVTDAITVVVSEETGEISVTEGGRLYRRLDEDEMRQQLFDRFVKDEDEASSSKWNGWLSALFASGDDKEGDDDDE